MSSYWSDGHIQMRNPYKLILMFSRSLFLIYHYPFVVMIIAPKQNKFSIIHNSQEDYVSPKPMLLPVAMFTNLNSEPYLQGIAWLVAKFSKLLEPTSSLKKCRAYTYR